jgi:hypothetical protein
MRIFVLLAVLALVSACQNSPGNRPAAQAAGAPSGPVIDPNLKAPQKFTLFVKRGGLFYSAELVNSGMQGRVEITCDITPENRCENPQIKKSSSDPRVDNLAKAVVLVNAIQPEKRRSPTAPEPVEMLVVFSTSDPNKLYSDKSCEQFIKDINYFRRTFPGKSIDDFYDITAMRGLLLLFFLEDPKAMATREITSDALVTAMEAQCQANPTKPALRLMAELLGYDFNQLKNRQSPPQRYTPTTPPPKPLTPAGPAISH